jgi:hypothetical protein
MRKDIADVWKDAPRARGEYLSSLFAGMIAFFTALALELEPEEEQDDALTYRPPSPSSAS